MSKSPYNISAKVLGIGVAVITKTSGLFPFATIVPLCITPNLCCSSVTTKPNLLNSTSSTRSEWVPIKISISPLFILSNISFLFFLLVPPNNISHFMLYWFNILLNSSKCCEASIAVGAIIAT